MNVKASTRYNVLCRDVEGNVKWEEDFSNLVVTAGLNDLLDATFKTGLASPAWYIGLKGTGTVDPSDTMPSHAGWSEVTAYSDTYRQTLNLTGNSISAGSISNSANKAVFNCNGSATVAGIFLVTIHTKSDSTGILYGAGDFTAPRSIASGDTLTITVTLTMTAA